MKSPLSCSLAVATAFLAGCAASTQTSAPSQSSASSASVASTQTTSQQKYKTMWVDPPVGSHLGGGVVRIAKQPATSNDEAGLLTSINALNAAAGSPRERPFVISAVARTTGVSERQLQAQQDLLRLRFGELLAVNAIARGNSTKVHEIANLKAQGRTWTDLARLNGLNIATLAEMARNASQLTSDGFSNSMERQKGGDRKLQEMSVRPQVRPGS